MNYSALIWGLFYGFSDENDKIADYSAEIRRIAGF